MSQISKVDSKFDCRFLSVSIGQALDIIKDNLHFEKESNMVSLPLMECLGRVVAKDLISPMNQPPFARSPYDGYALRAKDISNAQISNPVFVTVVGEINAGEVYSGTVEKNEALRIMTGAEIPKGADCVVKQEDSDYGDRLAAIYRSANSNDNICFEGEDFRKGDCLVKRNTFLTAIELGLLAGVGFVNVPVYELPRIGLFTTGDELVFPGKELNIGEIYNSNLFVLWGRLRAMGLEPEIIQSLGDSKEQVAAVLMKYANELDLIITTGGVSVGKKDIMHSAFQCMGADKLFWKVKLKPGSPTIFAVYDDVPIIALSGNPSGAVTNFDLLVRFALFEMTGNENLKLFRKKGIIQNSFQKTSDCLRYIYGVYGDGQVFLPGGAASSNAFRSMIGCNCLVEIEEGNQGIVKGDQVEVLVWYG